MVPLIEQAQEVTREQLDDLLNIPDSAEQLLDSFQQHGVQADMGLAEAALARVVELLDGIHLNLMEFAQLTTAPPPTLLNHAQLQGHDLRRVDNVFRHGLRILLPDTLPSARGFGAIGDHLQL